MSAFVLDGYDNVINILRKMPEDGYRKPVMAAFKAAAEPVKEAMINSLPPELRKLKKAIKIKPGKSKRPSLAVGVYGRQMLYRNRRGVDWDPYMLIYWHNYGTIAGRSPLHQFKNKVRPASLRRGGGIRARLFIENAVAASLPKAERRFETAYAFEHHRFLEKEAAKW